MADKGYGGGTIRQQVYVHNMHPVLSRKRAARKGSSSLDIGLYRYWDLVENEFARMKHSQAIATRYDKLKRNCESMPVASLVADVKRQ